MARHIIYLGNNNKKLENKNDKTRFKARNFKDSK